MKFAVAALLVCVGQNSLAAQLPAIVATYRSERAPAGSEHANPAQIVEWKFQRGADYVLVSDEARQRAERWQRDTAGRLWYSRLFHAEKKIIEYQPADLSLGAITNSWARIASVIDPLSLQKLTLAAEKETVLGREASVYRGVVAGTTVEVWWLTREGIPAFVEKRERDQVHSMRLTGIAALDAEHAVAGAIPNDYDVLDFSDLGDKESDPFVQQLMRHEGGWFGHSH